jgi:hypothetical protein
VAELALAAQDRSQAPRDYAWPAPLWAEGSDPSLSPLWQERLVWAFLVLGLLARVLRYVLRFPLWEDECFLCVNFMNRGFLDLLKPLDCHQTAPVLFLWTELAAARVLGFSDLTLRLVPFLASLAGLVLAVHVFRRLLRGTALVACVAFIAVAYPGIRHAAEAKQYGTDFFFATALIAVVLEWWRQPQRTAWLWALAALAPVAVGMSYPCIFIIAGAAVVVLAVLYRQRRWRCLLPLAVSCLAAAGVFVLLYFLSMRGQSQAEMTYMLGAWRRAFPPPIWQPLALAGWLLKIHAGAMLAIPVGADNGGSSLTLILCLVGLWVLISRRAWPLVLLVLVPPAVQLAAAAMKRYPYGDAVKFTQPYLMTVCLLAGLGVARLLSLFAARPRHSGRAVLIVLGLLAALGIGTMARDVAMPYKTPSDQRARAFAQWFWFSGNVKGQLLCAEQDLHLNFTPQMFHELSWGAMYYCNEHLYRPGAHPRGLSDPASIGSDLPLRVAVFRPDERAHDKLHLDQAALNAWLEAMQQKYDLVLRESYPMFRKDKKDRKIIARDYVEVYRFEARSSK